MTYAWFDVTRNAGIARIMHMSYRSKTYTWNDVILVKRSMIVYYTINSVLIIQQSSVSVSNNYLQCLHREPKDCKNKSRKRVI